MLKKVFWLTFISTYSLCINSVSAQLYVGLAMNAGNRLSYSTPKDFKRSITLSGSVALSAIKEINNAWVIQYGGALGLLGYTMNVELATNRQSADPSFPFEEYGTLYGNGEVLAGKHFRIQTKEFTVCVGGGITYYYTTFPTTEYEISSSDPKALNDKFFAEITAVNKAVPFGKIAVQMKIGKHLLVGSHCNYHFSSVLKGAYQFVDSPAHSGTISLNQSELSIFCMYRISKPKME